MKDCIIIGGGIGGLALTHALQEAGLSVLLLEQDSQLGGVIRSEKQSGYLLEYGPNSCIAKPFLSDYLKAIGLEDQICTPRPLAANRFLVSANGKNAPLSLMSVPRSPIKALNWPALSLRAKLRLLAEPFIRKGKQKDESVDDFISRRFGAEFSNTIVSAMLGGIWAADTKKLSARSALPTLWKLEQSRGSVSLGALRKYFAKKGSSNRVRPKLISFTDGMQMLTNRVFHRIDMENIRLGAEVLRLGVLESGINVYFTDHTRGLSAATPTRVLAKRVVIATPSSSAAALINEHDQALANAISAVPYAPLGIVHLAFDRDAVEHPLDGFGFLHPPTEESSLLGAIFSSSLFENRAPDNKVLLTCFMGGARKPEMANAELPVVQQQAVAEVRALIGAKKAPKILGAKFWPRAIPNYAPGHYNLCQAVDRFEANNPRISLLGNWREGISVPDRIQHALKLAATISTELLGNNPEVQQKTANL